MSDWHDFFVAQAGVAGALIGLLFIAVSINLSRIVEHAHLPRRAAEVVVLFFVVVVASACCLVPGQSSAVLGAELGATGIAAWGFLLASVIRTRESDRKYDRHVRRVLLNQLPPLPFIAAGAGMIAGHAGAVYCLLPGTLMCFGAGVFGAWVLLVEILR